MFVNQVVSEMPGAPYGDVRDREEPLRNEEECGEAGSVVKRFVMPRVTCSSR